VHVGSLKLLLRSGSRNATLPTIAQYVETRVNEQPHQTISGEARQARRGRVSAKSSIAGLPVWQRELADARAEVLSAVLQFQALGYALGAAIEKYNFGRLEISESTLKLIPSISVSWIYRFRSKQKRAGLSGLTSGYGNRAGSGSIDMQPELRDFILGLLGNNSLLSAATLWKAADAHFAELPVSVPSRGNLRRWLGRWKRANRETLERRRDPDRHKNRFLPAIGRMSDAVTHPLERVEIDGSPMDLYCLDGRYHLTLAVEVFSRRAVGIVQKTASADAAMLCLRKLILKFGVPATVRHDRGQEFLSAHFQSALDSCEIASDPTPPFSGEKKPHVERLNGTIMHAFAPMLPGFIGANVAERRAIESRKSFARRLGEDRNTRFEVRLMAADLQARLDEWLDRLYANERHAGLDGATPNEIWAAAVASGWTARRLPERALDVLLAPGGARRVGKKGIVVRKVDFWDDSLIPYLGATLRVSFCEEMGKLFVFAPDGEFLCVTRNAELSGISRRDMAVSARSTFRRYQKTQRAHDRRLKARFTPERALREMIARADSGTPLTPIMLHEVSRLDSALAAVAASDAPASGDSVPPVRVTTIRRSEAAFSEYVRLRDLPPENLSSEEREALGVYEAGAGFRARQRLGLVA